MFGRQLPAAVRHPYRDIVKPGVRFFQTTVRSIRDVLEKAPSRDFQPGRLIPVLSQTTVTVGVVAEATAATRGAILAEASESSCQFSTRG